ncbi:MAG: cryptochrome/photolyase family protein [Cytophagaceae bacterium]|jgi:deoxyribodipyrimidine photolyase-related protein|nr:cryptochrome/photolyase family protein [Cytophagaceae bacterium]
MKKTLRLLLGDQQNPHHSWFREVDPSVVYVMMEIRSETDYVPHHVQKVIAFFASMRHFASELKSMGHTLIYLKISDPENQQSFDKNLIALFASGSFGKFEYQEPDEWRVDVLLREVIKAQGWNATMYDAEHFFTSRSELAELFKGKKQYLMETFYRTMRRKHHILMEGKEPVGGKWNYDVENRKGFNKKVDIPFPKNFQHSLERIHRELIAAEVTTIGEVDPASFIWPVSRKDGLEVLRYFCDYLLPDFGTYQDAMSKQHWSLFHSRLSFSLNVKHLHPREVIEAAVKAWEKNPDRIGIAQLEGFVRQILGWREYMRGVYWANMPGYASLNYFQHTKPLPSWFWNGHTKMNCLRHAISQSLEYAYAHHIQRLMVTGNFCLLAGIEPSEVDQWYLGIYIDAIEWVEITNTRGMSQYADGGIVGTKPYVSSAAYIDKMSDYCAGCHYDKKKKVGDGACPFNSLYWHFYNRNEHLLGKNPRIGMMYKVWHSMDAEVKKNVVKQAEYYLKEIETL